jgi:hypothetical protein
MTGTLHNASLPLLPTSCFFFQHKTHTHTRTHSARIHHGPVHDTVTVKYCSAQRLKPLPSSHSGATPSVRLCDRPAFLHGCLRAFPAVAPVAIHEGVAFPCSIVLLRRWEHGGPAPGAAYMWVCTSLVVRCCWRIKRMSSNVHIDVMHMLYLFHGGVIK